MQQKKNEFVSRSWLYFLQLADLKQSQSVFLLSWGQLFFSILCIGVQVWPCNSTEHKEKGPQLRDQQSADSCAVLYCTPDIDLSTLVILFFVGVSDIKRGLKGTENNQRKRIYCALLHAEGHISSRVRTAFPGSWEDLESSRSQIASECWLGLVSDKQTIFCSQHRDRAVAIHQGLPW